MIDIHRLKIESVHVLRQCHCVFPLSGLQCLGLQQSVPLQLMSLPPAQDIAAGPEELRQLSLYLSSEVFSLRLLKIVYICSTCPQLEFDLEWRWNWINLARSQGVAGHHSFFLKQQKTFRRNMLLICLHLKGVFTYVPFQHSKLWHTELVGQLFWQGGLVLKEEKGQTKYRAKAKV